MIVVPAPMIAGPRTTQPSRTAPASTTTVPSRRTFSATVPSIRRVMPSSMIRLASRMSSRRPVSFHHPEMTWALTLASSSLISRWIASVISSSPRALGTMVSMASKMRAENMYTPTSARSEGGCSGFSTRRTTRSPSSSATPNRCGSGTRASRIIASALLRRKLST